MRLMRYNHPQLFNFPFDRFFDGFLPTAAAPENGQAVGDASAFAPRVDVRNEDDAVLLSAELPGVGKDGLSVEVKDGVLTITGEKKEAHSDQDKGVYLSERTFGSFRRSFTLPEKVDAEKIEATYADGVLKLRLPKVPEAAPRQIAIQSDSGQKKIGVK